MASGNPKFGGTNGVALLDIGQSGGTRQAANQALFIGHVIPGADEAPRVETKLPQQEGVFSDMMGFAGSRVTWLGSIKTDSSARMVTIIKELNQRKHGSLRNAAGELQVVDPAMIKETQLTDFDGNVLSLRAVFYDWGPRGEILTVTGSAWARLMRVTIMFRLLG